MIGVLLFALMAFAFAWALPHPHGLIVAIGLPIVAGIVTLALEGADGFAWGAWIVTMAVVALAAFGGRFVRERYGTGDGRPASAR